VIKQPAGFDVFILLVGENLEVVSNTDVVPNAIIV
jgi:hypothetical protein